MKPEEAIEGLNHELLILECFIEDQAGNPTVLTVGVSNDTEWETDCVR